MSATQVIEEIDKLPVSEQREVFTALAQRMMTLQEKVEGENHLGRKYSFEEACELVFRENKDLLRLLAK